MCISPESKWYRHQLNVFVLMSFLKNQGVIVIANENEKCEAFAFGM